MPRSACALFWLRPNRQIRAPIWSYKVKAQRRKIIIKYGLLYALVFAFFAALIVLPVSCLWSSHLTEANKLRLRCQVVFRDNLNEVSCSICNNI